MRRSFKYAFSGLLICGLISGAALAVTAVPQVATDRTPAMASQPTDPEAVPEVIDVRLGINQENTRFVMETSRKISFTVSQLADPYRVIVDIDQVDWKKNTSGEGAGKGIVEKYRFGPYTPGTSRIVLDLKGPARIVHSFIIPPRDKAAYRLVIDLGETAREDFLKNVKAQNPAAPATSASDSRAGKTADNRAESIAPESIVSDNSNSRPAKEPAKSSPKAPAKSIQTASFGKKVIVIDPGHGGIDPGSPSVTGVPEKFVTLAAAKAVRDALNATGRYRAILTRDSDVFIPLRQRFEIARRDKADLFISFHADSHADSAIRGATVYTLSERASDREAAALAAKENKADLIAGVNLGGETPEVSNILIDLAQHETMNYSAHFANLLVDEFKDEIALGRNSHRFAGFVVLKAPDIPSVLVEMGYLSNLKDATLLSSPAHRVKFSEAVLRAVDDYFTKVAAR